MAENAFVDLSQLLTQVNWDNVTDVDSFEDLPAGYYLCRLDKAELKTNKQNTNMQVSMTFTVIENGVQEVLDERGYSVMQEISGTHNRKVFKHYPFKDVSGVKRFVSDMIKFENPEAPGTPFLPKEAFMTQELISEAIGALIGQLIYVSCEHKNSNGQESVWYSIVGWDRAGTLGLSK